MTFSVNGITAITTDRIVQLTTGSTASRPASPVVGQLFYDTTLGRPIVWNGTAWREPLSEGSAEAFFPLWTWGRNNFVQLGSNSTYLSLLSRVSPGTVAGTPTDWIQVSAGSRASGAIRANGQAWCWGDNGDGQLGDGTTVERSSPVSVVGGITDWVQISATYRFTVAVRGNGQIWSWGRNSDGQLGDNTITNRSSPVSVVGGFSDWRMVSTGTIHTAAIRSNGQAWCWGSNLTGQIGDNTLTNRSSPVSVVGGFTNWVQISAGRYHTAGLRTNGQVWCWGYNFRGSLGDGTTVERSSPVSVVGGFTNWVQIGAVGDATVGLRSNGQAWAWGRNDVGQLGDGTTTSRSSPVSVVGGFTDWVQISSGGIGGHILAIRANGQAWGWGSGLNGRIGDGTTTNRSSPVSVVGGFSDWTQISAGDQFSAGIRTQPRGRRATKLSRIVF